MIVTLTPNPSLDRALEVEELRRGEVNRAFASHVHAGGKGINVSRVLVRQAVPSVAVLPSGGAEGVQLVQLLAEHDVPAHPVPVSGDVRTNLTLVERDGPTTKVNAPGPRLTEAEVAALLGAVEERLVDGPAWLVAAGSLPLGAPATFFVSVALLAHRHGVPFALDTSGSPLAHAVQAGGLTLVKPNDDELAELVGRDLVTVGDAVTAARVVLDQRNDAVLLSLGSHGALLVTRDGTWWAGGEPLVPVSTVGAGDTTLAGYLVADGDPGERLRQAVAFGRAAVLLPGTAVPAPHDIHPEEVRVVAEPHPDTALKEL
jgi:1-phosphofructokinase